MSASSISENAVIRPWGWYLATCQTNGYKTKSISVVPGKRLSLQSHSRRKEMWSIVRGEGIRTVDSNLMQVSENSLISVPKGVKHSIENISMDTATISVS